MTVEEAKARRALYLVVSCTSMLFLGLIYAFSLFTEPMSQVFGHNAGRLTLTFNIMMIGFCLGNLGGGQVERIAGVRVAMFAGGSMFLAGFAGTALFGSCSIVVVYVLYGLCAGLGVGFGYNTVVSVTNLWFPEKVGFSSGVMMLCFGASTLVLGNVTLSLIGIFGLPTVFIGAGLCAFVSCAACGMVLRRPPSGIVELMTGRGAGPASESDPADDDRISKSPTFFLYWLWAILMMALGFATIGSCASDAQIAGLGASSASLLVGFVSTANGLSRIAMGFIFDRSNVKVAVLVNSVLALASVALIFIALQASASTLYVIGALLCGFCYGATPVVSSAFVRQRYGAKNYSTNLSVVNCAGILGSVIVMVSQAAVGGVGNREGLFAVLLVVAAVALADVFPFSKLVDRDEARLQEERARRALRC